MEPSNSVAEQARLVRIWAENRVDAASGHNLPANQREAKIKQLIDQRHNERKSKPVEFELDPDIKI